MPPGILTKEESDELERQLLDSKQRQKGGLRNCRQVHYFASISLSLIMKVCGHGRKKYRMIVCATWFSLLWDGWVGRKGKSHKRSPTNNVLMTRRLMHSNFGYNPSTFQLAISDLLETGIITVVKKGFYSGGSDTNKGAFYKVDWMKKKDESKVRIYWGLLISNAFLSLSIPAQATLILLHTLHNRNKNTLYIKPDSLAKFGIHRNTLPKHLDEIRFSNLLDYVDGNTYQFTWFDERGGLDFSGTIKKTVHLTQSSDAPNSVHKEFFSGVTYAPKSDRIGL